MNDNTDERWRKLAAEAAKEQDPKKLLALIEEINRRLEERRERLKHKPAHG